MSTDVSDRVRYRLPLGRLGNLLAGRLGNLLAGPLVRRNLSRIFTFRQTALAAIFANGSGQQAAP